MSQLSPLREIDCKFNWDKVCNRALFVLFESMKKAFIKKFYLDLYSIGSYSLIHI